MKTRIQKWGNSLAVRIPKAFAAEMGVEENSSIEMMLKEGALVIEPGREGTWTLEGLLAEVTDENTHPEWETGDAAGDELW